MTNPQLPQDDGQPRVPAWPKYLMFALAALALLSSVLMLFSESEKWLKLSVIAALWAAFLGVWLATRYSSALDSAQANAQRLTQTHQAELDKEKAEHRQREAQLASEYEQRHSAERDEHIQALRSELRQMRIQLAQMSGGTFPSEDQAAVQAHAERIRELDSSASFAGGSVLNPTRNAANQDRDNVAPRHHSQQGDAQQNPQQTPQAGRTAAAGSAETSGKRAKPQASGAETFNTGTFAAVRWGGQDTEETTQIPLVVDTSSMDTKASHARPDNVESAQAAQPHQEAQAAQPHQEAQERQGSHRHRRDDQDQPDAQGQGGRRRAEGAEGKLTVAELMSRFKK